MKARMRPFTVLLAPVLVLAAGGCATVFQATAPPTMPAGIRLEPEKVVVRLEPLTPVRAPESPGEREP